MQEASVDVNYSIYWDCLNLQSRLFSLPGFALYSDLLSHPDPVVCIVELFTLGIPFCYLFNLLPHRVYPKIDLDFTLARDDEYTKRLAIAHFALRVHQAFGCEHFTLEDVLRPDSTKGIRKALNAAHAVLRELAYHKSHPHQAAVLSDPAHEPESSKDGALSQAVNNLLASERAYIVKMETLERLSVALGSSGILDPQTLSLVFPQKMFIFARKFCIQLEFIAQMPRKERRWGAPFITHAMDIAVNLRIHCVNSELLQPTLANLDMKSLIVPGLQTSRESVDALLSAPMQRLADYREMLSDIISSSGPNTPSEHHQELVTARACLERAMDGAREAQKQAKFDQMMKTLTSRIADWNGLRVNMGTSSADSGFFVLEEDTVLVRKNDIFQNYNAYLFESVLILCNEDLPPPPITNTHSGSRIGRRKVSSGSDNPPPAKVAMLYVKDHFRIQDILSIVTREFERAEDTGVQTYFETVLHVGGFNSTVSLLHRRKEESEKWYTALEDARQAQDLRNGDGIEPARARHTQVKPDTTLDSPQPAPRPVEKLHPISTSTSTFVTHATHNNGHGSRRRASTFNGTLTNLDNGRPLPEYLGLGAIYGKDGGRGKTFVKLHFDQHTFVLSAPQPVTYDDLMDRIDKKLRYCPGWGRDGAYIANNTAEGQTIPIRPETSLASIFKEGIMVSLKVTSGSNHAYTVPTIGR